MLPQKAAPLSHFKDPNARPTLRPAAGPPVFVQFNRHFDHAAIDPALWVYQKRRGVQNLVRSTQLSKKVVSIGVMGNCLSIKVDTKRRVWVRKRRQRPDHLHQQMPYPSHGTAYQDTLPKSKPSRGHRRRANSSDDGLLPYYRAVTSDGHPMPALGYGNLHPGTSPAPATPAQPMPTQPMPAQQMPTQQMPAQQMPTHQVPAQQAPVQNTMAPQQAVDQSFTHPPSQQSTIGMDPNIVRNMMQST